jgi:hypothetical protein
VGEQLPGQLGAGSEKVLAAVQHDEGFFVPQVVAKDGGL